MITLKMFPNQDPVSWSDFCNNTPQYSIAIDGYVNTGPMFQNEENGGPRANFNHHEEVDRLATRATCAQILMALRTGFYKAFRKDGQIECNIYANDCDQDVCTSYFILNNPWACENAINPLINKLTNIEDHLDATGGAYPYHKDMPILKTLAWIFKPYTDFRLNQKIDLAITSDFVDVVKKVEDRIMKYINGKARTVKLDTRYDVLHRAPTWSMVIEHGAQARTGMFSDGIYAYIAMRTRPDTKYNYTIGRMSQFVDFDVPGLLAFLSSLEPDKNASWGGGSTSGINIGGSNRKLGSSQNPQDVIKAVELYLKPNKKKSARY